MKKEKLITRLLGLGAVFVGVAFFLSFSLNEDLTVRSSPVHRDVVAESGDLKHVLLDLADKSVASGSVSVAHESKQIEKGQVPLPALFSSLPNRVMGCEQSAAGATCEKQAETSKGGVLSPGLSQFTAVARDRVDSHVSTKNSSSVLGGKQPATIVGKSDIIVKRPIHSPSIKSAVIPVKTHGRHGRRWVLRVGSFHNYTNAKRLVAVLKSRGLQPVLKQDQAHSSVWYRVSLKPVAHYTDALMLKDKVRHLVKLTGVIRAIKR